MRRINVILVFLLSCLLFAGCEKDDRSRDIIGKWELTSFSYWGTFVLLDNGEYEYKKPKIDYQPANTIYDFQKNGKLVVTYFISGELKKNEYSYKCKKMSKNPLGDDIQGEGVQLQIDEDLFNCAFVPKYKSLPASLSIIAGKRKTMDDVDLVMIEYDDISWWIKTFYKSK